MGKMKIGIYCYLTAVILIKDLQICTKPTNFVRNAELIVAMATESPNLQKR